MSDEIEIVQTEHVTETVTDFSDDGNTLTETTTVTDETPIVTPSLSDEVLSKLTAIEGRIARLESTDEPGVPQPTATETVVESPPPDKPDPAEKGTAESIETPPAEVEPTRKKRKAAGFFF